MAAKLLFVLVFLLVNLNVNTLTVDGVGNGLAENEDLLTKLSTDDEFKKTGYEIAAKLQHHPELIYSDFMDDHYRSMQSEEMTSPQCIADMLTMLSDLGKFQFYAMQMVDSMGKPGAGILNGNFQWLGSWEQCKAVIVPEEAFRPQYCISYINLFLLAVCVPDSCNEADVTSFMNVSMMALLNNTAFAATETRCIHDIEWSAGDTAMAVVICIFVVLVLASTAYEYYMKNVKPKAPKEQMYENGSYKPTTSTVTEKETQLNGIKTISVENLDTNVKDPSAANGPEKQANGSTTVLVQQSNPDITGQKKKQDSKNEVLQSFSLISNGLKLINMTSTPKGMEALNGMRVISMAWIILGHTYRLMTTFTSNVLTVYATTPKTFSFQFVFEADLAVDTFFYLSGFLVAFGTMKVLRKSKGRLNWALFYINRYLRLTPIYMFVLFFWITMTVQLISGPYDDKRMLFAVDKCYKNWWQNIIYMNSVLSEVLEMCMLWSWYLANDMIYFILSPLFIYTMYRKRFLGYFLILLGLLGNSILIGVIYNKYGLADKAAVQADDTKTEYSNDVYFKPAYRIAPYLIGLFMADFYVWTKDKARNMQETWWKVLVVVLWAVAIGMNWALLYGIYPYNKVGTEITPFWLQELYASTYRIIWALICAWISYACMTGWGGIINTLLSMKIWEPLVRLCYLAYLTHPVVMFTFFTNMQQTIMGNHYIYAYLFVAYLGITFAASTILHLFVEQPLGRLQRHFLR